MASKSSKTIVTCQAKLLIFEFEPRLAHRKEFVKLGGDFFLEATPLILESYDFLDHFPYLSKKFRHLDILSGLLL